LGGVALILLDTHIWVWWVQGDRRLRPPQRLILRKSESQGLGVSVISCWEVAELVQKRRLELPCPVTTWLHSALDYPGIQLVAFTTRIAVEANQLPGQFHRDPADQIIVATARVQDLPLLTADARILLYPHVKLALPKQ
jgi:PIN domain nuclease of toxin-antitoxin system